MKAVYIDSFAIKKAHDTIQERCLEFVDTSIYIDFATNPWGRSANTQPWTAIEDPVYESQFIFCTSQSIDNPA